MKPARQTFIYRMLGKAVQSSCSTHQKIHRPPSLRCCSAAPRRGLTDGEVQLRARSSLCGATAAKGLQVFGYAELLKPRCESMLARGCSLQLFAALRGWVERCEVREYDDSSQSAVARSSRSLGRPVLPAITIPPVDNHIWH